MFVLSSACTGAPGVEGTGGAGIRGGLPVVGDAARSIGWLVGGPERCLASVVYDRVVVTPGRCVRGATAAQLALILRDATSATQVGAIFRTGQPDEDPRRDTEIAVLALSDVPPVQMIGAQRTWPTSWRGAWVVGYFNQYLWGGAATVASRAARSITLSGIATCTDAQGEDPGRDRGGPVFLAQPPQQLGVAALVQYGRCDGQTIALPLGPAGGALDEAARWVRSTGKPGPEYGSDAGEGEYEDEEPPYDEEPQVDEEPPADEPPPAPEPPSCACDTTFGVCDVDDGGIERKCACDPDCCFCSWTAYDVGLPECSSCTDSCDLAGNGTCDEPDWCGPGTDATDCGG